MTLVRAVKVEYLLWVLWAAVNKRTVARRRLNGRFQFTLVNIHVPNGHVKAEEAARREPAIIEFKE